METPSVQLTSSPPAHRLHVSTGNAVSSCKRCRQKKLRCDALPGQCRNCSKTGVPCITIDATSKREYERGYVDELLRKIERLERLLNPNGQPPSSTSQTPKEVHGNTQRESDDRTPSTVSAYHGSGSVISIARLVAVAVTANASGRPFSHLGAAATREQYQTEILLAQPASRPPMLVAEQLLDSYMNGGHILHPFLQRSVIQEIFKAAYNDVETIDPGDNFTFYMVCAIGALSLCRLGLHDTPAIDYYMAAMPFEADAFNLQGIEQAQRVLLVLLYALQYEIGIGNKWDLARLAMRICVASGLHKACRSPKPPMEEQMRRRIFWAAYVSDRHSSMMLGRPMAIPDKEITVDLPIEADDDLIEAGRAVEQSQRGESEVSSQLRQIRIRQITSKIHQLQSLSNMPNSKPDDRIAREIFQSLEDWRQSIPIIANPRNAYESAEWMELNYQRERMNCLHITASIGGRDDSTQPVELEQCLDVAVMVVQCYQALPTSDRSVMNWTCVQDILRSGFTILYCLHAIRKSKPRQIGGATQGPPEYSTALEAIRACAGFLRHIAQRWKTVERHARIFENMATEICRQVESSVDLTNFSAHPSGGEQPFLDSAVGSGNANTLLSNEAVAFEDFDLGNVDFNALNWDEIFACGTESINIDDYMTL